MLLSSSLRGQTQNQIWSNGGQGIVNFNSSVPVYNVLPGNSSSNGSGLYSRTHNSMQDKNGNLLFYTVDENVYTSSGNLIGQITVPGSSYQPIRGFTEFLLVPVPDHCTQYYLIAGEETDLTNPVTSNPQPYYALLDMAVANSDYPGVMGQLYGASHWSGGVEAIQLISYFNQNPHSGSIHFAVTHLRTNSNDRFLYVSSPSHVFRFKVTGTGIVYDNYQYFLQGNGFPGNNSSLMRGEMEIVKLPNGNYRMAAPYNTTSGLGEYSVFLYEINGITGDITSSQQLYYTSIPWPALRNQPKGLEFSPNGQYLYVMHTYAPYFECYDVNNNMQQVSLTGTSITNGIDFAYSQIELGFDGKLYMAANNRYASFSNPDNPTIGLWTDPSVGLGAGSVGTVQTVIGPNGTPDDQIRILNDQIDGEDYAAVLNLLTPSITCSPSCNYCGTGPIQLNAGNYASYQWSNGATTQFINANVSGPYTVTVTNSNGCQGTTSTQVTINPQPTSAFNLPTDCKSTAQFILLSALQTPNLGITYTWVVNGATTSPLNVQNVNAFWSTPGTYNITLTVSTGACTSTTTQTITISDPHVCCDENSFWQFSNLNTSSGPATWTSTANPMNITGNIYVRDVFDIAPGADITLEGMTFIFGLNAKVIVHPGAKLTLQGTTFTSNTSCGNMWQGVETRGIAGSLFVTDHGVLNVLDDANGNHSVIENAVGGIRNFDANTNSKFGGILTATNAVFRNNLIGVYIGFNDMLFNTQTNNSINGCTFSCPNTLLYNAQIPGYIRTYADLVMVRNQNMGNMIGNHFRDADMGIWGIDSKFNISQSQFNTTRVGILSQKVKPQFESQHIFDNNYFQNFYTGIRIEGGFSDQLTANDFNLAVGTQFDNMEGIRMESASGFFIKDNNFKKCRFGIVVNNSGKLGGTIAGGNGATQIGNYFSGCWRGVYAYHDNPFLNIHCNTFENYQLDIDFSAPIVVYGPMADQGSYNPSDPYSPVHNDFLNPVGRVNIYSNSNNFYYYPYDLGSDPTGYPNVLGLVTVVPTLVIKPQDACDGHHRYGNDTTSNQYNTSIAKQLIETETDDAIRQMMINQLVNWYVNHNEVDSAISYLELSGNEAANELLLPMYIRQGWLNEAQVLVNERAQLTDPESMDYVSLHTILINWEIYGVSPFEMNQIERDVISSVATSGTRISPQAQAILHWVFGEQYQPAVIDTAFERLMKPEDVINSGNGNIDWIRSIRPNPVQDNITIDFTAVLPNNAELEIRDYIGRIVKRHTLPPNSFSTTINVASFFKWVLQNTFVN